MEVDIKRTWGRLSLRQQRQIGGLFSGILIALSIPPYGFWILAPFGFAGLYLTQYQLPWRDSMRVGFLFALSWIGISLWWVHEFHWIGYVVLVLFECILFVVCFAAVRRRCAAYEILMAVVLFELLRGVIPFGGFPLGSVALGAVASPMARVAGLLGSLGLIAVVGAIGLGIGLAIQKRWVNAAVFVGLSVVVVMVAIVAFPASKNAKTMTIAAVQGGGKRGLRAVETNRHQVLERQLTQTGKLSHPVDLILWPEDIIDVSQPVANTIDGLDVGHIARNLNSPILTGVTIDNKPGQFLNQTILWDQNGNVVGSYDKIHRVPFGEFVPERKLFDRFFNLSNVPNDAIAGHKVGVMAIGKNKVGVVMSYEVFFPRLVNATVTHGAQVVLVPTNAASYNTSQVPSQEVAAAQLRAIESNRWIVQAAPTGYTAVVSNTGKIKSRSALGKASTTDAKVHLLSGRTVYSRIGDLPLIVLLAVGVFYQIVQAIRKRRGNPNPNMVS